MASHSISSTLFCVLLYFVGEFHEKNIEVTQSWHVFFLDSNVNMVPDLDDVTNLRAASPVGSVCRGSQCSQVTTYNKLIVNLTSMPYFHKL